MDERQVFSVSGLNRAARVVLESGLGVVWVEGELSNLARPSSGHWYFSLKDRDAQIRCAMFRAKNLLARFQPGEGQRVLARGRISLYEPRGDYQLIVEYLEEAGLGALQRAFDELKQKLAAEGLFAVERKRALPTAPMRIGVITSPTGAAIRDILHVLQKRFPAAGVIVYPVPVQGAAAAPAIVEALQLANARAECQVLIVARGGGSLEDLWAFNDERVARAIAASTLPVVAGIGHEVDFTIADFVADLRAPTPSAAAQAVVPDHNVWRASVIQLAQRVAAAMRRQLGDDARQLQLLEARLRRVHPGARLQQHGQRLDELEQRLLRAWQRRLREAGARLESAARALHGLSPLATLGRGFAIATRSADGAVLTQTAQAPAGTAIEVRLAQGKLKATVTGSSE